MDPGVATTRPEYTEVFNGGGSEGEGPRRHGGHAQFYASVMVIVAALEARECEKI